MALAPVLLRDVLPKAGFIWPEDSVTILSNRRRDDKAASCLRAAAPLFRKSDVEPLLAEIFTTAATLVCDRDDIVTYQFLISLRTRVGWVMGHICGGVGAKLGIGVFKRLFEAIRGARLAWHASPRPPFCTSRHGPLALSVDRFLRASEGRWHEVDNELWEMAGGDDSQNEDDDPVDEDERERGASWAREDEQVEHGSGNPATPASFEKEDALLRRLLAVREAGDGGEGLVYPLGQLSVSHG